MLKDWEIVHEMDDEETGSPTCYAKNFEGQFFWVTQFPDGWYVEINPYEDYYRTLKVLKTAKGCMRWVEKNYKKYLYNKKED